MTVLPSGHVRWRAMVNGVRGGGTEASSGAAKLARSRFLAAGGTRVRVKVTVGELLDAQLAFADRAGTTLDNYHWARKHLPTDFLGRDVGAVDPPAIVALWKAMQEAGAPPHALVKTRDLCSTAWHQAQLEGIVPVGAYMTVDGIRSNPWHVATPPSPPAADEVVPPSVDEVQRLIALAGDRPLALWIRMVAKTGPRGGELCAVRWSDLRLDKAEIAYGPNVTRKGEITSGKNNRRTAKSNDQTNGHRTVPLDPATVAAIKRHPRIVGCPWLFTFDGVNPWKPDRAATAIRRLCESTKPRTDEEREDPDRLPPLDVSPHDLRHFAATQWLDAQVPPATVAYLLGDDVTTVNKTYAHWVPATGREAVESLARKIDDVG